MTIGRRKESAKRAIPTRIYEVTFEPEGSVEEINPYRGFSIPLIKLL